ncbi:bifunctional UDP-N-acetylglucosamine diphosphorylase/glucosamine-1-phosphate N-acetyltransferase GlmU [Listeria fleischmannii]|jgi:bifunctional UDP-N-acetylglucosamine pyrophosphorylase/glucosamine-1-phosphate N-acetyltransferase|uniref:Bifunctional protein GlmU n=1 Tax=Listeria fleischmannii TaxID=1069827 RepID=A0A841YFC4_9LIST|nr:bifunctional UDP-N-acetylglucosamine diphosphorylase/glucosamine-1-phosphate N-acetyltransferase GlmU [Listeria fleischmannii]EIA20997.1 bifunctional N-acetylglucosamine-1-phosphate uridyltransferase/glucosamine-1-phosphate acetyltransferase [Listeria fleischmannii subsp. coloradonensis]MBC1398981.1 bifunctional UDP-N-acetylglucosamine diphosphorylase/glucosamine-1-phosphate N-acetyltransferase GlmU [Listeria fleischmannii]MBC1419701.1 bifunctional UDP-N-acetylglucosamine diphosphorylase/gluc
MTNQYAIVLAAGQGTRMKSKLYKVLHPVCGKPMVEHVVDQIAQLDMKKIVTIVGHGAEDVQEHLRDKSEFVKQEEQLGTAHAVLQAKELLADLDGVTIVVCGDTPLIESTTMGALIKYHSEKRAKATILTTQLDDPTGYGRILRDDLGIVERIVEHKDATEKEQRVQEINTGTYCFDNRALFEALSKVSNDNAQGEYYLPDVIKILKDSDEVVAAYRMENFEESLGVNDRVALAEASRLMRNRINERLMREGVTLVDPNSTYIDVDVEIGQDTVIEANVTLRGNTKIGEDCLITSGCDFDNAVIGNRTIIRSSAIEDSKVGDDVQIGPFAHLRPESEIHDHVKIGNYVETKKAVVGENTKLPHFIYMGDAEIGKNVNVGCGSISVNYDGFNKSKTVIGDNVFVGCNSNLIAPINIADNVYIAAGSTLTDDVPEGALAVGRARQVNKEGYAKKIVEKFNK